MVLVISKQKKPLAPISNVGARRLLSAGRAVVHNYYPFVIRLKFDVKEQTETFIIKIDPGSKETGIAILHENLAIFLAIIQHRGLEVKRSLKKRRAHRRSKRNRKTRYRKARFENRTRPKGWIPPSLKSRADNIINIVKKFQKWVPIKEIQIEEVSFNVSSMTAEVELNGVDYKKGPLFETTLRKAVFEKSDGKCVYCGENGTEMEHLVPNSYGGTKSLQNLVCSCRPCNELKGKLSLKEFGKLIGKDLKHLEPKKLPIDAAIVQSMKTYTKSKLEKLGELKVFPAWMTKLNRIENGFSKQHFFDAVCVGENQEYFIERTLDKVLIIKAIGRGNRQMCLMDKYGFPRTSAKGAKRVLGFQSGDRVKAVVSKGKKTGTHIGKVAVRSTGNFNIGTGKELVQGIKASNCKLLQRTDGFDYNIRSLYAFENSKFPSPNMNVRFGMLRMLTAINGDVSVGV